MHIFTLTPTPSAALFVAFPDGSCNADEKGDTEHHRRRDHERYHGGGHCMRHHFCKHLHSNITIWHLRLLRFYTLSMYYCAVSVRLSHVDIMLKRLNLGW